MKGFLSRLGPPVSLTSSDSDSSGFTGRQFSLARHQVVVEEKLGEGGFALVFRVRSQLDGRVYALKRMCVNDDQAMQVCMVEVSLVRSIAHRNIVRYVDHAVHQLPNGVREILLLMVYYRNSLSDLLNRCAQSGRHLPEQQVMRIFVDVCSAVAQLHLRRPPVQHRDLKAENVLAASDDPDGAFVLCDFGSASERPLLASALGAARVEEEIKKYTTLSYRSPEMIDMYSGLAIDTKSDIWALGCLLYRLAYLGLPFGESSLAISSAKVCLPDSPVRSAGLRRLIGFMLRPEPSDRPDIRQLACVACRLAGRQCDIPGIETVTIPQLESLPMPPFESEAREASAIRKSPSSSQLQSQQQQQLGMGSSSAFLKPAASGQAAAGAATPSCARQRPRPGGLQTPPVSVPVPPPPQPQQQPVDLLSVGSGPQIRHRRLVSDTSGLRLPPGPTSSASPLFDNPTGPDAAVHQQKPRQRVLSLEKLSAPVAPATAVLVDLDDPPVAAASSAAVAAYRSGSGGGGWAAQAGSFAALVPDAAATAAAAPLEDSAFGDEFDKIRGVGSISNISQPQTPMQPQPQPVKPAKPAPMPSGVPTASRPAAVRPVLTAGGARPQQQQRQHQQQYWGGPGPRHPSQLMNQQVFWPN